MRANNNFSKEYLSGLMSLYAECKVRVKYIDLGQPKSGAPQLFFGMLLLMKIIQRVCEVNCE